MSDEFDCDDADNVISETIFDWDNEKIIKDYLFAKREPLRDEVLELIECKQPTLLERKKVRDRILSRILSYVDTFINGMIGK